MRSATPQATVYKVDANDLLVGVSPSWDIFARSNGAPELAGRAVLGRSLWEFIRSSQVRDLYAHLMDRVRMTDAPIMVPFRCDSPACRREMRLVLAHVIDGIVQFDAASVRSTPRDKQFWIESGPPDADRTVRMCSLCKRIESPPGVWSEIEDVVGRLSLADYPAGHHVKQSLCDACEAVVGAAV